MLVIDDVDDELRLKQELSLHHKNETALHVLHLSQWSNDAIRRHVLVM